MAGLTEQDKQALQLFKRHVLEEFGDRVESIQLFGSKARSEANQESDVDVLVKLTHGTKEDRRLVSKIAFDITMKTGTFISPVTLTQEQFDHMRDRRAAFWLDIQSDLVPV